MFIAQKMLFKYLIINFALFANFGYMLHTQPNFDEAYFVRKISSFACAGDSTKLMSLLNLLCNATQSTSPTTRDACYGCFFRAGSLPTGGTQLSSLSQCATMYLSGSIFASCATNLQAMAGGTKPTPSPTYGNCYTGYCEFVRCVRRINVDSLIDNCVRETMVRRILTNQANRIAFYVNATSCILARTRCSQYNPISGELQTAQRIYYNPFYPSTSGTFLSNSLQITSTGDVRIISFGMATGITEFFCSSQNALDQSTYGNITC